MMEMPDNSAVLACADNGLKASLARLFEVLRFASVGTDPAYHGACDACAQWLVKYFQAMGFTAQIRPTTGRPAVVATLSSKAMPSHAPHVLFYGHYDVQPPDPLELWESPPFEPAIRKNGLGEDAIFARGAHDDKGQLMTFLEASRAWLSVHGRLPFRLTAVIEGDEEGESAHFDRFLAANRKEFKSDIALVCDTEMWDADTPAITTRLRGCVTEEITIEGPSKDLHSGYFGGAAINPIRVLTRIVGDLHDRNGRIALSGFYDGVGPVPAKTRRQWKGLRFNERRFMKSIGLASPAGEKGYSVIEQIWARPTAEANGIFGGYTGEGRKTVLPASATAKLTFRTVGDQDPKQIKAALRRFVNKRLPKDCKVKMGFNGADSRAVMLPEDNRFLVRAAKALGREWRREPVLIGSGGSIPAVATLKRELGVDSLLIGFAQHDDAAHSPNEKYDMKSFHKGIRSWVRVIGALGEGDGKP
jgi:acetylornithine deacetylase/succinyl-diaminopimelate desuccinylase-like protein